MASTVAGLVGIILLVTPHLEVFSGNKIADRALTACGLVFIGLMLLDAPTVIGVFVEQAQRAAAEVLDWFLPALEDIGTPTPPPSTMP